MKITDLTMVEENPMTMEGAKGVKKQIPLARADSVPQHSLRVFTIEPGGHTPYHSHPFEHMNYVINGTGALVDKDGQERPVRKGDFALVMPDEIHQYKNTASEGSFVIICLVPKEYE